MNKLKELDADTKNLIDNATKLIEEHKQTKTQLEMHIAFNKQLLGELEKLDNENKRLKKELQEEKEEKEHYQAIVESWE